MCVCVSYKWWLQSVIENHAYIYINDQNATEQQLDRMKEQTENPRKRRSHEDTKQCIARKRDRSKYISKLEDVRI